MPKLTVGKSWQRLWPRKLSIVKDVRSAALLWGRGKGRGVWYGGHTSTSSQDPFFLFRSVFIQCMYAMMVFDVVYSRIQ